MGSNPVRMSVLAAEQQTPPTAAPEDEAEGQATRRLAIEALERIESGGAYANLVLPPMLERSGLRDDDRRFVTELVYGTTRMKRACDYLVDRYVLGATDGQVRAALRLGAYQLHYLRTPDHAAVNATVAAVRGKGRSLVNAVLRRVAAEEGEVRFPSIGVELSYPDWVVERFTADLGRDEAVQALRAMNRPAAVIERDDGYVQDPASQAVAAALGAGPGDIVVDLCAAPGGKATALAATGAMVVAADRRLSRSRLVAANADRLGSDLGVVVSDGRSPGLRPRQATKVLVDAPCSGFGSFRRRADARWRIEPEAPERLQELQVALVKAGLDLLAPGGTLTYSVCTLTRVETVEVAKAVLADGGVRLVPPRVDDGWGRLDDDVALLLPDTTDGMGLFQLQRD